jgi:regulator of RNase E activity RraA
MRAIVAMLGFACAAAGQYLPAKVSAADKTLFEKLARTELEALWSAVVAEGYPLCFIHELDPIHNDRTMVGRARTVRYLPNRKDVREKLYGAGPQLNYKSAEEAEPGDVLVFDAGGETRSAVTGVMTTTRFVARGGVGMIADGAFRDVPGMAKLPIQVYMRRGQAAAVSPGMMSVDYQVPVRVGGVTVIPGDILVGERHGILVIPAGIVQKVLERASAAWDREQFQEELLKNGESIYGVYPQLNEANRKRFEEWLKKKGL